MKALLIDPEAQTIEPIEIHGEADIVSISGNDKITSEPTSGGREAQSSSVDILSSSERTIG